MTSLLPPADDLFLLHERRYETRVYYLDDDTLLVRGAIADTKPPGLYIVDDPDPLEIHNMQIELEVRRSDLAIVRAQVGFESHPHESCPRISEHYESLIGLNIARGFTRKVREMFGGPRGCAHTTALLQAMAPAVLQSLWSMDLKRRRDRPDAPPPVDDPDLAARFAHNVNTCHIWAEDGEHVATLGRGEFPPPPLQIRRRLADLGRSEEEWRR
ncbi:MAG: DUF2889 domain-containing protein [Acidimicrobiales bacterium]|nr:DUF2889 domain-containing protein [Acidimicrobiales bacterium]